MDYQKQFMAALKVVLQVKGHGTQARIADKLGIERPQFNNMIKCRRPCDEGTRRRISEIIGEPYDDMIRLGKNIIPTTPESVANISGGKTMRTIGEWISTQEDSEDYWVELKQYLKKEYPEFREFLKKGPAKIYDMAVFRDYKQSGTFFK